MLCFYCNCIKTLFLGLSYKGVEKLLIDNRMSCLMEIMERKKIDPTELLTHGENLIFQSPSNDLIAAIFLHYFKNNQEKMEAELLTVI